MNIIYLVILIAVVYICKQHDSFSLYKVKATVDDEEYLVKKTDDLERDKKSANKLANINEKVQILIKSLSSTDEHRKLLENAPLKFQERKDSKDIGYTINKGEKIGMCTDGTNDNGLFFIVLHELAHVITKEYGHPEAFWKNFEKLIKKSVELGIYNYRNYNTDPVNICNYEISYTPYSHGK